MGRATIRSSAVFTAGFLVLGAVSAVGADTVSLPSDYPTFGDNPSYAGSPIFDITDGSGKEFEAHYVVADTGTTDMQAMVPASDGGWIGSNRTTTTRKLVTLSADLTRSEQSADVAGFQGVIGETGNHMVVHAYDGSNHASVAVNKTSGAKISRPESIQTGGVASEHPIGRTVGSDASAGGIVVWDLATNTVTEPFSSLGLSLFDTNRTISRDGTVVAFGAGDKVYVTSAEGGQTIETYDVPGAGSYDGVVIAGEANEYVFVAAQGNDGFDGYRRITRSTGAIETTGGANIVSPNGRFVAYNPDGPWAYDNTRRAVQTLHIEDLRTGSLRKVNVVAHENEPLPVELSPLLTAEAVSNDGLTLRYQVSRCDSDCGAAVYYNSLGTITLEQVPYVFTDLFETETLHRGHSTVLRLYWAVFAREPELGGAQFWLKSYNSGEWSTRRIAAFFAQSDEFEGLYGSSLSTDEFVTVVYRNVLGREPDAEGHAYWVGQVNGGMSREEMILLVSNATEFIAAHPLPSDSASDTGPLG